MNTFASNQTQARPDDSPLGVALVIAGLAIVVGLVLILWLPVAPPAALSSEQYLLLPRGAALTFRVRNPDGTITYRSRNVNRSAANEQSGDLPLGVFTALIHAAGIDLERMSAAEGLAALSRFDVAEITDTEYDVSGKALGQTRTYALVKPDGIEQFGVDTVGIVPAVPLLPRTTDVETVTGKLNDTLPFTVTQQTEARAGYTGELGAFPDCIQVRATTTVGETATNALTWYCAGVGQVHDETTDAAGTKTSELIAASVGTFSRGSAPVVAMPGQVAAPRSVFPQPIRGTLVLQLDYKEPTESQGITTNILPLDGMLLYGTHSGALVALDRAAEKPVWRFQTGGSIYSTPIAANGIVYFGSGDAHIYAVRASDGAFLWAFRTNDTVSASPAVQGDTVFVASEDRHLYALDADTGRLRWTFRASSPLVAPPLVTPELIYASDDDGALYALRPVAGDLVWKFDADSAITAPVTIEGDLLYFGSYDQHVYALNRLNGEPVWSREVGDNIYYAVVVGSGRVYVVLPTEVFALDATNGNPVWHYDSARTLFGAPALLGNQLWLLRSSDLTALDAASGAVLSQTHTSESGVNAGLSCDGREIYVGFFDGFLKSYAGVTP